jgi:hypothetical protein
MGTFIELLLNNNYKIFLYYAHYNKKTDFINYYMKNINLINKNINNIEEYVIIKSYDELEIDINTIDYLIFCTDTDYINDFDILKNYSHKIISISHQSYTTPMSRIKYMNNKIILSKLVTHKSKFYNHLKLNYIFPLYLNINIEDTKYYKITNKIKNIKIDYDNILDEKIYEDKFNEHFSYLWNNNNNLYFDEDIQESNINSNYSNFNKTTSPTILSLIGAINGKDIDDIKLILNNYKDKVIIYYFSKTYKNKIIHTFEQYKNIKIFIDCETSEMIKKIRETKFILSIFEKNGRYHTDRMSGVLPFSFNVGIPLVTDMYIKNIYKFNNAGVLSYKNTVLEIIDYLINIKPYSYYKLLKEQYNFKKRIYDKNKKTLFNIINPHINRIKQYNGGILNINNNVNITNDYGEIIGIDAVYTWVDMNDPKWLEKYRKYTGENPGSHRFKDNGELEFSIQLLKKNCDFIRNIYIITDQQIPNWLIKKRESELESEKKWCKNIFIVDHLDIMNGKCNLPTFKSNTIESFLHNIKDYQNIFFILMMIHLLDVNAV